MAVSKRKKLLKVKRQQKKEMHPLMYEILGLLLIALAVIMIFEYGMIGRILQTIAMFLLVIYILLFHLCLYLLHC